MIEITERKFRLEEGDDNFLMEAAIRNMHGYMSLRYYRKDEIIAEFWSRVI